MKVVPVPCEGVSVGAAFDHRYRPLWNVSSEHFSREAFLVTLESLVEYPERTSSAILRADVEGELQARPTDASRLRISGWNVDRLIRRHLLPRNPAMDGSMSQNCYFLSPVGNIARPAGLTDALVIFEPLDDSCIPFYHPQVSALAFHYTEDKTTISYVPIHGNTDEHGNVGDSTVARSSQERLHRTLYQLLSIIIKHSIGYMNNYQKRVLHDVLVPRNDWQDLYTSLKGRLAAGYITSWAESTDPKKHVFEDLGIASFLINLWKSNALANPQGPLSFVDVGCGNGLLVDILLREGWLGYGFDARHRKSWQGYQSATQLMLKEMILYPELLNTLDSNLDGASRTLPSTSITELQSQATTTSVSLNYGNFNSAQFLIGNHADELTPYIPLLSAISSLTSSREDMIPDDKGLVYTTGFMIIPCCTHTFSGEKHNALSTKGGRYNSYLTWLVTICEAVGWVVEKEALRIPSTRNWAIIGRRRRRIENAPNDETDNLEAQQERLVRICRELIAENGGMAGFLMRAKGLTQSNPRSH